MPSGVSQGSADVASPCGSAGSANSIVAKFGMRVIARSSRVLSLLYAALDFVVHIPDFTVVTVEGPERIILERAEIAANKLVGGAGMNQTPAKHKHEALPVKPLEVADDG